MEHVIGLDAAAATQHALVGGKGANLAKTMQAGFPVPPAFCVTTHAYGDFVRVHGLDRSIRDILGGLDPEDNVALEATTARIRKLIEAAPVDPATAQAIREAYAKLPGEPYVAVRSSGTAEDLTEASFAGMHDTYLDVKGADAVIDAVRRCWASLWTPRATAYRAKKGFDGNTVGIAVVVQMMVESEVSGVMFTANPLNTATDEILINASWGLGEAVVQGITNPDTFIVKSRNLRVRERTIGNKEVRIVRNRETGAGVVTQEVPAIERARCTLDEAQVQALSDLGRRVQTFYEEMPQDIEWGLAKGTFYLLQSRPITGVEFSWDSDVDDWYTIEDDDEDCWSRTWADEGWTGAITPLMYSWRAPSWIAGHDPTAKLWGRDDLIPIRMWKYHKGEAYWNLRKEKLYVEHTMPPQFRKLGVSTHLPEPMLDDTLKKPFDWLNYFGLYARMNVFRPRQDRLWGWLKHFDDHYFNNSRELAYANGPSDDEFRRMSDNELKKTVVRYKEFEDKYNEIFWTGAFIYVRDAMCVLLVMLRTWYRGDADKAYMDLLSGSFKRTPTIVQNHVLWQLAQDIRKSDQLMKRLATSTAADFFHQCAEIPEGKSFLANYQAFVKDSAHRGHADRDVYFPRRSEDPTGDFNALRGFVTVDEDPEEREREINERRERTLDEVVTQLKRTPLGALKGEAVKLVVDWMQKFIVFRDTERNFIDRSTFTIKRAFLEANRRLMERGLVESDRDFWFLTVDELWTLLGGRANRTLTRAKVAARMKNFDRFDHKEYAPPMYLQKGLPVDLDAPKGAADEPGVLRGSGTSSGKVTGTARVIKSLGGLSRLRRGEILVCNATDPGWTSAFSLIKGIVTETGGPLAHAACLAREYGLPSVQIVNAVQLIPDGATITIDGSGGRVTIVDAAGGEPANDPEATRGAAAS